MFYELGLGGCWDLCAGVLVLEEAGGRVLDPTGAPAPRLPASCLWLYFCLRIESVLAPAPSGATCTHAGLRVRAAAAD